ncbi:MAG: TIGR00730 family Rossman fold protein [Nitrospirae bacterium]|nr:MAG: TIGR00730 family Rossman fold protein [Nitrospirota bacterium]
MRRVCVFCGSSAGRDGSYVQIAKEVGQELLRRDLGLVYGGGNIGLMGILAETVLRGGGSVIGVIPQFMVEKELARTDLTALHVVGSMHERKALMAELSDAFLALPGGLGTLEEFCEIVTWKQLGLHKKPCGLLNAHGYYDGLLRLLTHQEQEGFVSATTRALIMEAAHPAVLLDRMLQLGSQ